MTKAIGAVAHSILVMAYSVLSRMEPYRKAGADFFDRLNPEATAQRLVRRLQQLGYQADLRPLPVSLAAWRFGGFC